MRRPSRAAVIAGSLAFTGLLVGGTAYAAAATTADADTYYACENDASGALRMIDPGLAETCDDRVGPTHETLISWSRAPGLQGPEGPRGPRGPRGDSNGKSVDDLGDLVGMSCTSGSERGRVVLSVAPPEHGSTITLVCKTRGTVDGPIKVTPTRPPVPTTTPPTSHPYPTPTPRPGDPGSGTGGPDDHGQPVTSPPPVTASPPSPDLGNPVGGVVGGL